jgi:hypothetical protein
MVEYEDEFGRVRTARRSEVPRNLVLNREDEVDEDEDIIIRNPVNHFPTYQPSEERIAEIAKAHAEENNPLGLHYDASKEIRAKGAGFYQFSADEETRLAQMEELKASREETTRIRQDIGAEDVRPGEVEGMREGDGSGTPAVGKSRAMEKRKREIDERMQILEVKRRRLRGTDADSTPISNATSNPLLSNSKAKEKTSISLPGSDVAPTIIQDPFTSLEVQLAGPQPGKNTVARVSFDPFSRLEKDTNISTKTKGKMKAGTPSNEADSFLAQLEEEFLAPRFKTQT